MGWGTIASIAGGIAGPVINAVSQHRTNQMQRGMARDAQQWEQGMSNTAHQREVEDLKAAGLNPILSAGGSGASTPNAQVPGLTAPQVNLPDFMAYGVSLKQLEQKDKELALATSANAADVANKTEDTKLKRASTELAQRGLVRATVEGEAANLLKGLIKGVKKNMQPTEMAPRDSSGAELPPINGQGKFQLNQGQW